jgi:hypothetical protein
MRTPIDSAAVWRPADLDPAEWTFTFTDDHRAEILGALRHAVERGATIGTLTAADFPLPTLSDHAVRWSEALNEGRGFVLLRRFPVDLLEPAEVELAYVGLGAHLGTPVGQDAAGTLLGHVRDEGVERTDPSVRLYRTRQRQDFHTDGADLVGLLCLHRARSGGESRIASSAAVYNELLRRRPDLVEVLYWPMHWDRNDEEPDGEPPTFELPVFTDLLGSPRIFYIGWYIREAQRHAGVPPLTAPQVAALDELEAIANDPAVYLEMDFQPGDVQLLNNGRILHSREAYEDHEDPVERRHLLRLWLAAHHFDAVEELLQGGIPRQAS